MQSAVLQCKQGEIGGLASKLHLEGGLLRTLEPYLTMSIISTDSAKINDSFKTHPQ